MHLGLIDGPFVPHTLISTRENPVLLPKFQMVPRLKILMASGSKKGTKTYFSFFLKVPPNEPPPGSPTGPLWRGRRLRGILHISQKPHFSGSPIKEPSPWSPSWNPSQIYAPPLQPSFIHLSKSPVYVPPSHIPGSPQMERGPHGISLTPLHVMAGSQHSAHCYSNLLRV